MAQVSEKKWTAPAVRVGDIVFWRSSPNDHQVTAAIVTTAGQGGLLSVSLFVDGARTIQPVDSVRHKSDPELYKFAHMGAGVWEARD